MAAVHLIFGRVGAGKTTYARELAATRRAMLFVIDEWMAALYMMDAPTPITLEWALPRTERAERQIWAVAQQALAVGVDVILELGFFRRAQRDRVRALVGAYQTHFVDAPVEVRRERVRARNRGSATFTVEVDDAMFDWAEQFFEPLGDDELRGATIINRP